MRASKRHVWTCGFNSLNNPLISAQTTMFWSLSVFMVCCYFQMTSPHIFPRSLISLSLYIYIHTYTHTYLYLYLSLYIYRKTHVANGFHLFIDMWAKYPTKKFCISHAGRYMGLVRDLCLWSDFCVRTVDFWVYHLVICYIAMENHHF